MICSFSPKKHHYKENLRDGTNLSTRTKHPVPNAVTPRRFHCTYINGQTRLHYPARLRARVTRKMVPITGRERSFLLVFKNKIERRGRLNKNNRPINLPNVITFSLSTLPNPNLYHTQYILFIYIYIIYIHTYIHIYFVLVNFY